MKYKSGKDTTVAVGCQVGNRVIKDLMMIKARATVYGLVRTLFGDSSTHGTRIYQLICTEAGKFKAIAALVDEINYMEAHESDLVKDVDQKS